MYIGCLNDKLGRIDYQVYQKDTHEVPQMRVSGNPFLGEQLYISWRELLETGVDLHINVEEGYFLNEIVLTLAKKSAPNSIKLFTADKKTELYCFSGETGKAIQDKIIALPIDSKDTQFVIEINVAFSDVIFDKIELYGAEFSGETLFPIPVEIIQNSEKEYEATEFTSYSYDTEIGEKAAKVLKEKLEEITGVSPEKTENGKIKFIQNDSVEENGYRLSVNSEEVKIEASDLRGMVYAAEVFIKMASKGTVPECTINDSPHVPFRGVHLYVPHPSQFEFARRMVKYVLSPMGYNCIIMVLAGGMEYESHPEINTCVREAYTKGMAGEWPVFPFGIVGGGETVKKALIRDFVEYCREFGIDVIPEIQSLGHVQFMTIAHPDIAEREEQETEKEKIDGKDEDIPPSEFYAHSYCPSNPKSYEILFDLIDEIIEVFTPKEYVHLGHDEVYQIGICPKCKDKDPAQLLAEDINRIHDYLAKKGLKMMIWADMLQRADKYKTTPAIDMIPKDVLLMDFVWYFYMDKDIEDNLLSKGFKVCMGNMYSSHYPRYESRIVKDGMVGAQISMWAQTIEKNISRQGKFYDLLYSAQMMWSAGYTSHARYSYDKLISAMMPNLREKMKDVKYPSLMEDKEEVVVVDRGIYHPKNAVCRERYVIGEKAHSVIFEHTATTKITRIEWTELEEIGTYQVTYTDGTIVSIPVKYSGNISYWNRRQNEPYVYRYYRHNGYQGVSYETDGIEVRDPEYGYITMYRYEWINPNPDQEIATIEYQPKETSKTDVYVGRISLITS